MGSIGLVIELIRPGYIAFILFRRVPVAEQRVSSHAPNKTRFFMVIERGGEGEEEERSRWMG